MRSIQVLRYLASAPDERVGVRTLAASLKMAPSTVHRVLTALVAEGLVEHRPDTGLYGLGLEMVRLAHVVVERLPIQKIAMPYLRELVKAAKETALLGLYDRTRQEVMFVASAESTQPLRYVNRMRTWLPIHAGATGLAIMAFLPEEEREEVIVRSGLAPITDRTVTDRRKLEQLLERIRRNGYACTIGQRTPGAVAVAAPIFGPGSEVIGDIIITLPEQRFDRANEAYLASQVVRCARAVTHELGGPVPDAVSSASSQAFPLNRSSRASAGVQAAARAGRRATLAG
ncbi:MAG TPA: IclR family transcriptional regulator [Xanthobacteraceae bacterium]|jgi:DNA-binding IclR family transcriptional regulator|nr:IclR family transcriptional regulator [Xanthobacteraceae bacterium]